MVENVHFCISFCFEGLVNKILSAHFWIPLSRLTYCAYLLHPIALITLFGSFETVRAYSDVHVVSKFPSSLFTFLYPVWLQFGKKKDFKLTIQKLTILQPDVLSVDSALI